MLAGKMLLLQGAVVGDRYLVEEILGTGGFGAVYLVSDQQADGALFALKEVIEPTEHARDRLAREGELLERLQHPALPRVFRLFIDEQSERVYLLMEYIEGLDLEQVWRERPDRRFALPEVLDIMAPIIEAVAYLHRQHPPVLHRDMKPANIILRATDHTAMLVDFGIAGAYALLLQTLSCIASVEIWDHSTAPFPAYRLQYSQRLLAYRNEPARDKIGDSHADQSACDSDNSYETGECSYSLHAHH